MIHSPGFYEYIPRLFRYSRYHFECCRPSRMSLPGTYIRSRIWKERCARVRTSPRHGMYSPSRVCDHFQRQHRASPKIQRARHRTLRSYQHHKRPATRYRASLTSWASQETPKMVECDFPRGFFELEVEILTRDPHVYYKCS